MYDGVPPPKYTKLSGRPAIARCVLYSSHSRASDVEVALHLGGVLVGVDAEVAEVAALPAERDVQVEAERDVAGGDASAGRASVSTASFVHTENGG